MSNQPYEGNQSYDGYDPHQQQPPGRPAQQQPYDDVADQQQYTQQWEGRAWETQARPPIAPGGSNATDMAYGAQRYGVTGQPLPAETGWDQVAQAQGHQAQGHQVQGHQVQGLGNLGPGPAPASAPVSPSASQSASPSGEAAPGYGPPTVTGNPRVTDAQRARAEGRSPIIEPGGQPAVLTAALGLLLAGAAAVGTYALVVPLVILQAVTAAGWFRLNGMWPARQGIALAFAGALTADVALLATGQENAPATILGTLGVWVLLTLGLQLRSHAEPDERMYGLMATVASAALAIVATGHLAADPDAVTVGAVAVGAAVLARALPLPTPASVIVALLAAAGTGIAAGGLTGLGTDGALLGAAAGACALIGHRVAGYDYPSRFVHFTAGVALPLAAAAPAIYLLGRALG